jgi:hypothetical protein
MDMEAELRLLLEERAIMRTLNTYSHAMDYGREQDWVHVFTDDGVFDVVSMPGAKPIHREDGAGDLAAYVAQYPKPPNARKHIVVSPIIEIDGDTATVDSYWLFFGRNVDGTSIQGYGRYHDQMVKVDGEWRIKERYAETEAAHWFEENRQIVNK